jgi:NTP pyrophosphatase (non-canonical NTP hydrolase)
MDDDATVSQLKSLIEVFVQERDWAQFHSPKNSSMAIAVEAAELMDLFKWHSETSTTIAVQSPATRQAAIDELAYVFIYALALANRADIDVTDAVRQKVEKNRQKYPTERYKGRF